MIFSDDQEGYLNSARKAPYIAIDKTDIYPTRPKPIYQAEAQYLPRKELAYFNGKKLKAIQPKPFHPYLFLQTHHEKIYVRTFYEEHDVDLPHLFQNYQEDIATLVYIDRSVNLLEEVCKTTQGDSEGRKKYYAQLTLGNQYLFGVSISKDLQKAISHYNQALLLLPNSLQAGNNLACAYIQSLQYVKAQKVLLSSIKHNKFSYELYHNLAYAKLMIGKLKGDPRFPFILEVKEAEECLNKALLLNPKSHQTMHNLANISVYKKKYKEAIEQYKQGIQMNDRYASSLYSLAIAYKLAGEYSLSLQTYLLCLKYHKNHGFSIHGLANLLVDLIYLQIEAISCKHMEIFSQLVKSQKYFNLAINQRVKCIEQIYKLALQNIPNSSLILSALGNLYILMRRYDLALKTFQRAIYFNKRCYPAYNGSGLALYYLKRYEDAVVWFDQCFKINRRSQKALLGKFHNLIKMERIQQAKSILNMMNALFNEPNINFYYSCLTINENQVMSALHSQLLKASHNSKQKKIAADIMLEFNRFETSLKIYSDLAQQQGNMNLDCLIGICHQGLGKNMQSMQSYIESLNINPQNSRSLLKIAQFFYQKGELRDSQIIVNKLLQINGNSIKVLTIYAKMLQEANRIEQLIGVLTLISKLSCYSSESYNNLAIVNLKKGDLYESDRYLQLALNKDKSNYIILNNLGNIYHERRNSLANQYYLKVIAQDQSFFLPYINMESSKGFEEAMKKTSTKQIPLKKMFNFSLYFLFQQQFDTSFQYFTHFLQYFQRQPTQCQECLVLYFLWQNYPSNKHLRKILELYLYQLNGKSELYLKQVLKSYNPANGYQNAVLRLKEDALKHSFKQQQNLNSIYLQILASIFKISHYQGVKTNGVLCWNDFSFQDNTLRIQMCKRYQLYDLQMVKSSKELILSIISNRTFSDIIQQQALVKLCTKLQKANRIHSIITSNQQISKLYLQLIQQFTIQQHEFVQCLYRTLKTQINHYEQFKIAYINTLDAIQTEQETLLTSLQYIDFIPNKFSRQCGQMIAEIFLQYYHQSFFANVFIVFTYNTFIFYGQQEQFEIALKQQFITMKRPQSDLQGSMKKVISLMDKQSKLTSKSNFSKFTFSLSTKSQQLTTSKQFQQQLQASFIKKDIIQDTISQASSLIFERISYNLDATIFLQETIFGTANNNTPQYRQLKRLVQTNKEYQSFNILLNNNRKYCYEYISKKSNFLEHMNPNVKYSNIMEEEILVTADRILSSGKQQVINYLLCTAKAIIELEQLGIFHGDICFRNFIKSEDHYKIIDFDYAFQFRPSHDDQNMFNMTQELLQRILLSPSKKMQQNKLKFIFKYRDQLEDLMKISEQYGSNDLTIDHGVKILLEKLGQHAIESHFRQFCTMLQEILDQHNFHHIIGQPSHQQIVIRQFIRIKNHNHTIYKQFFEKFQKMHASMAKGTSLYEKTH